MSYGALRGIRIADLGIITSGGSTSALLADLGAEVIKVEGPPYTDPFRDWFEPTSSDAWWNESTPFNATNRNKKSLCLDLKEPEGRALFLRLVAKSDVVIENFRTGVLERLGLGFEALKEANGRIILASLSSQGVTGPNAMNVSFGSTLEASSGMAALMRYPGGIPHISGRAFNYPDQVVSLYAAGAVMTALIERARTGEAIRLDLSQRELTSYLIGEAIVSALDGVATDPYPVGAPASLQGEFKAADGQWVAVTIPERAAAAARSLLGAAPDASALARWLAARAAPEAARALRAAGAAAEVVVALQGYEDPDALASAYALASDSKGRPAKGLPLRLGETGLTHFPAAADLGADNHAIATSLLGLGEDEYQALEARGIFADRPRKSIETKTKT